MKAWTVRTSNWSRPISGRLALVALDRIGHPDFAQALLG